jgi:hypothetical protein
VVKVDQGNDGKEEWGRGERNTAKKNNMSN